MHLFFILFSAVLFTLVGYYCGIHYKGNVRQTVPLFGCMSLLVVILLSVQELSGEQLLAQLLMSLVLLSAAYADDRTRLVEDYYHVMLLLIGCIGMELAVLPVRLTSAVAVLIFMTLVAIWTKKPSGEMMGGADIKLSAAMTFVVGIQNAGLALVMGMTLGVLCTLIKQFYRRKRYLSTRQEDGFALIPYLAVGFFLVNIL